MVSPKISKMGIELFDLLVENVSVPPEVEEAIDKRSSMGAVGNLDDYMKYQAGDAMVKGAENPSGTGAIGAQMAAGMMMGQQVSQSMQQPQQQVAPQQQAATPPPMPAPTQLYVAIDGKQTGPFDLETIKGMITSKQITDSTLVWKQGMAEWQKASEVDETKELFGVVPPPLPPQD